MGNSEFWTILAISSGMIFGAILFIAHVSRRISRSRIVRRDYVNLAWGSKKCPHCTMGTQALAYRENGHLEWGPLPEEWKMIRDGQKYAGSRQANVRACTTCNGTSRVPSPVPGVLDQGHVEILRED